MVVDDFAVYALRANRATHPFKSAVLFPALFVCQPGSIAASCASWLTHQRQPILFMPHLEDHNPLQKAPLKQACQKNFINFPIRLRSTIVNNCHNNKSGSPGIHSSELRSATRKLLYKFTCPRVAELLFFVPSSDETNLHYWRSEMTWIIKQSEL